MSLINVGRDISYLLLLSLGVTVVMITGGIDISVGKVSSLVHQGLYRLSRGAARGPTRRAAGERKLS